MYISASPQRVGGRPPNISHNPVVCDILVQRAHGIMIVSKIYNIDKKNLESYKLQKILVQINQQYFLEAKIISTCYDSVSVKWGLTGEE